MFTMSLALALSMLAAACSTRTTVHRETETTRQAPPRVIEERTVIQPAPAPQVEERETIIERRSTTESVE
jgi:hypothetical protein